MPKTETLYNGFRDREITKNKCVVILCRGLGDERIWNDSHILAPDVRGTVGAHCGCNLYTRVHFLNLFFSGMDTIYGDGYSIYAFTPEDPKKGRMACGGGSWKSYDVVLDLFFFLLRLWGDIGA